MKSWITNSEGMLGVSEKQAEKFSREWYNIKRQETSALWEQRQDIRKGEGISLTQLREKVAAAVKAKGARKAKTRTNEKYLKLSRSNLRTFWSKKGERRITLGASFTQFLVDADASDEERAKLKREKIIEKLHRSSWKRAAKRKQQRRQKLKRELEEEQEVAHIRPLLRLAQPVCATGSGYGARETGGPTQRLSLNQHPHALALKDISSSSSSSTLMNC